MENEKKVTVVEQNNVDLAEKYFTLVGEKNAEEIRKYLDPSVEFRGLWTILKGRTAVVIATRNFMKMFNSFKIRAKFGCAIRQWSSMI